MPPKRRKTAAERRAETEARDREAFEIFREKLEAVCDPVEAKLLAHASRPSSPGRRYYSNLAFFVDHAFQRPAGASQVELGLYIGLIRRLDEAGALVPGAAEEVVARLR